MPVEPEVANLAILYSRVKQQLHRVIVGQESFINELMICLFSGSHALIEGVPGLAKTLTIRTLASILDMKFSRIQFTPDLMPTDIVGTTILQEAAGHRSFEFAPGPVFAISCWLMKSIGRHRKPNRHYLNVCRNTG